jgi:hypothetical protein
MAPQDPRSAQQIETRKLQLSLVFMVVFYTTTKMSFVELLAIVVFGPDFRIIPGDTLVDPPLDSPIAWILGFLNLAVLTYGFSIFFRGCRLEVYSRPSPICDVITSLPALALAAFALLAGRPVPPGEFFSRVARWWWRSEELGGQAEIVAETEALFTPIGVTIGVSMAAAEVVVDHLWPMVRTYAAAESRKRD